MDDPTNADLMREIRRLREEVEALRGELRSAKSQFSNELVRLQDFAERMGLGRSTVYQKLNRRGIPVRDSHGYPKEDGDRSAAYLSVTEWEAREKLDTRTVRRNAGFYDD
jgi:predicted DNA-binding transcriptional regulator AlpA